MKGRLHAGSGASSVLIVDLKSSSSASDFNGTISIYDVTCELLGATHPPTNDLQAALQIETVPLKSDAELLNFKATIKTDEAPDPACKRPLMNEQSQRSAISFYFTEILHVPSKEDWKSACQ